MTDRLNTSDRKIIETQGGALRDPDFRLPEVDIVGREVSTVPDSGGSLPGDSGGQGTADIGVPTDIQIDRMEVRIQPDGSAVVDIVGSYVAAPGARSHEMRISKL